MRKLLLIAGLVLAVALLAIPAFAQDSAPATGSAYVRVAHYALNADVVDVYINGTLRSFGRDRAAGTVSNWLVVPEGEFTIEVKAAGRSATLVSATLDLARESFTTIMAIGDARAQDRSGVSAITIDETYADIPQYHARVIIVHAIPGVGPVDVLNAGELFLGRLGYPGSITLADGGTNDGITSVDLVAGSYDLTVVPNGQSGPVLLDLNNTVLEAGNTYLVVATVDAEGNPTASVTASTGR
jgi:hypothetical protein